MKYRHIFSCILTLCMLICLTACSESENRNPAQQYNNSGADITSAVSSPISTTTVAPTASPVPEEQTLRIAEKIDYTPDELKFCMKPSDTDLEDYVMGYYFVSLDGKKYRYQRDAFETKDLGTVENYVSELKFNNPGVSELHYKVYSLKEYPGFERLQLRCEEYPDDMYCIKYAPPRNDVEFTLDELKNDGFVIIEDNDYSYGGDIWNDFISKSEQKSEASVWVCYLTTKPGPNRKIYSEPPDEDLLKAQQDDFPIMQLAQIYYDGNEYTISPMHKIDGKYVLYYREGYDIDVRESTFKYLVHIVDEPTADWVTYKSRERYVLSDEENLTSEWISAEARSYDSERFPLVNYRIIYSSYEWKEE